MIRWDMGCMGLFLGEYTEYAFWILYIVYIL